MPIQFYMNGIKLEDKMDIFIVRSFTPITHGVINTNINGVMHYESKLHRARMICDLLNSIENCNTMIAEIGQTGPEDIREWEFLTTYYRQTRWQAINVVNMIIGRTIFGFCHECKLTNQNVFATHLHVGRRELSCELHASKNR